MSPAEKKKVERITVSGEQLVDKEKELYAITYNGELFNYKEIRDELKNLGYIFKTNSDTEVVLKKFGKNNKYYAR